MDTYFIKIKWTKNLEKVLKILGENKFTKWELPDWTYYSKEDFESGKQAIFDI